mmetsp:Transcript_48108/g.145303  ORF Transcript_48108/g.145303 Transcript_48108/m.145303 type:complete len:689 (-) Transcript_48108:153-2219(-)
MKKAMTLSSSGSTENPHLQPQVHGRHGHAQRRTSLQHRAAAEALIICRGGIGGRRRSLNKRLSLIGASGSSKANKAGEHTMTLLRRGTRSSANLAGAAAAAASSAASGHKKAGLGSSSGRGCNASSAAVRLSARLLVEQRKWKKLGALLDLEDSERREALSFDDDGDQGCDQVHRDREDGDKTERRIRRTPRCRLYSDGNLLHLAISLSAPRSVLCQVLSVDPSLASGTDAAGRSPLHIACDPTFVPVSGGSASSCGRRRSNDAPPDGATEIDPISDGDGTQRSLSVQRQISGLRSIRSSLGENGEPSSPGREGDHDRDSSSMPRQLSSSASAVATSFRPLPSLRCSSSDAAGSRGAGGRGYWGPRRKLSSSTLRILCDAHPPALLVEDRRGRAPVDLVIASRDAERERARRAGRPGELRRRTDADVSAEFVVRRTERAWTTRARSAARRSHRRLSALSSAVANDNGAPQEEYSIGDDNEAKAVTATDNNEAGRATITLPLPTNLEEVHQVPRPAEAFHASERQRRRWTSRRSSAASEVLEGFRSSEYGQTAAGDPASSQANARGEGEDPRVRIGLRATIGGRDDGIFVREDALRMFLGDDWYDDELGEERTSVESDSEDEYDEEEDDADMYDLDNCGQEETKNGIEYVDKEHQVEEWNVEPVRLATNGEVARGIPSTISFVPVGHSS